MKQLRNYLRISKREFILSLLAIAVLLICIPVVTYMYFAKDLASKQAIMNKNDTGLILLDRENKPFFTFYAATYKSFTPLPKLPKHVPHAVIASEDKDFYSHPGFSIPSIIRAFFVNISQKDHLYGGSTITQQLVKNALLNSNKTYMRKIQEIILAQEIERRYNKNEILEMYLNFVYYGENAFGIENAALTYFGKHAKDLSIAESAFLTALLPAPSALSPFSGNSKEVTHRQQIVLTKMYEQNYITKAEYETAKQQKLIFQPSERQVNAVAPHFALMVRDELIKKYGEDTLSRSGFRVKTTLDRNLQIYAENAVNNHVAKLKANNVSNGAAVVINPKTGEVLSLVGSANWYDERNGKINLATTPRSVGSSFKPIIYAAGLERRIITPATMLSDKPTTFPDQYKPLNYDRKFRGPVSVRHSLANSLNVPAVQVMQKVGLAEALTFSKQMGITTLSDPSQYGLSLVLGSGEVRLTELTNAYATFAANGAKPQTYLISEIANKDGKRIYKHETTSEQVISADVSFLISSILSDTTARSEIFGNLLNVSHQAAVKTGTAEDYKDALTVGYTPRVAVGVWVGNNNNKPMDSVAGSLGAAPIWKEIMEYEYRHIGYEPFKAPPTIVKAQTCNYSPRMNNVEYFINGTQPNDNCRWFAPVQPSPGSEPYQFSSQRERKLWKDTIKRQIREQLGQPEPSPTPVLTESPET